MSERQTATAASECRGPAEVTGRRLFLADDVRILKALGDETRLGIVLQLREQGDVCQCDMVACCELAQPTVSHHLRVLREAGIVSAEKRGIWMHYQLNPAALERLKRYLP